MPLDLYAGIYVRDYGIAKAWYERLLGPPTYVASDTEGVWELAPHRSLAIEQNAEHAGHSVQTIFVDDLDDLDGLLAELTERGLEPAKQDTYANGVRKALYRDPDGNEIGFGGAPV